MLPFLALLSAFLILSLARPKRIRIHRVAVPALMVSFLVFSGVVLTYELDHGTSLSEPTYSTALLLRDSGPNHRLIANDGLVGIRVAAVTGNPYLPIGGAGTTFQSPELLAYRYFNATEVETNVVASPLQDLTLDSDSPWAINTIQAELDWVHIMESPLGSLSVASVRYHPDTYLENKQFPGSYTAFGNVYPSALAESAYSSAYKLYDGESESVWFLGS